MKRLLAFFGLLLAALSARAEDFKTDPRIFEGKGEAEASSFLVVMREQADLAAAPGITNRTERRQFVYDALRSVALRAQAPLLERLGREGAPARSHWLVDMIEVEADRSLAAAIASRDDVAFLAPNRSAPLARQPVIREQEASSGSSPVSPLAPAAAEPNLVKIRAPEVWSQGFTGQGIVVGMADTGFVWDHPALKSHYRGFDGIAVDHAYNWHDAIHDALPGNPCGSDSPAPCDDDGHGTGTAALAVGDDGAGNAIGVAPGARFMGCRNMDRGAGTPARYTECFEFFLAPTDSSSRNARPDLGADVVNNSWGCPVSEGCTDPEVLRAVVENVTAAGILAVVSAGNEGPACSTIGIPAIYGASFTVGATTLGDAIATFSSRGPVTLDGSNRLKPDLSAPGVRVRTASPPNGYQTGFSGTSAAAPHVTGAVALLWSAVPRLAGDIAGTEDALRRSAVPLTSAESCGAFSGAAVPNPVFGSGRLDVAAAVALAGPAAPPPAGRFLIRPPARRGATRVVGPRP